MPSDEFFTEGNVLPEVRQAFASPERKEIGVIIRPAEDVSVEELVSFLRKKRIAGVEWTDYFARAIVRQRQVEILDKAKEIDKVWLDKPVEPKWEETTKTVKAEAAQKVFGAEGDGIGWAVLDSGIRHTHNFFKPLPGGPARVKRKADWNFASGAYKDGKGHGTHVAGIIAKLAPRCTIYDLQLLVHARRRWQPHADGRRVRHEHLRLRPTVPADGSDLPRSRDGYLHLRPRWRPADEGQHLLHLRRRKPDADCRRR